MTSGRRRDKKLSVLTVLALAGIALDHLVSSLEAGECHLSDRVLLMRCLLLRDDRSVGSKREVNAGEAERDIMSIQNTGK